MISFNIPVLTGKEALYLNKVLENRKFSGDGDFTKLCNQWFETNFACKKALLTTSGTHALEMVALLLDIQKDDEIILPSYTFTSTANAFILQKAKLVFVDIRPDTMNLNEKLLEAAITPKTKAICVVHYAGIACEMDYIMAIAKKHNLYVIEDAAQAVCSTYNGQFLGTIADFGCYSFHETKNFNSGEGGAIILNHNDTALKAEIIREKGTNRSRFFRGEVDKYTWIDQGSSYLPSELNAAFLYAQLEIAKEITQNRLESWQLYYELLTPLAEQGLIELPYLPSNCTHNGHMFYIKLANLTQRSACIQFLKQQQIMAVFHYIPLHSAPAGQKYGRFHGIDQYTTNESERLLRLPLYYQFRKEDIYYVVDKIKKFFDGSK